MKMEDENICYTIGHSNHQIENFLELLKLWKIEYIIDIRSVPYSKHSKQFNRETLLKNLRENGFQYRYLGSLVGGGIIRFHNSSQDIPILEEIISSEKFQRGITILKTFVLKGKKIALMCSERDPFVCHRFFLVSYCLQKRDVVIKHILYDGSIVDNIKLEKRLKEPLSQTNLLDYGKKDFNIEKLYEHHYLQILKKFSH